MRIAPRNSTAAEGADVEFARMKAGCQARVEKVLTRVRAHRQQGRLSGKQALVCWFIMSVFVLAVGAGILTLDQSVQAFVVSLSKMESLSP